MVAARPAEDMAAAGIATGWEAALVTDLDRSGMGRRAGDPADKQSREADTAVTRLAAQVDTVVEDHRLAAPADIAAVGTAAAVAVTLEEATVVEGPRVAVVAAEAPVAVAATAEAVHTVIADSSFAEKQSRLRAAFLLSASCHCYFPERTAIPITS